jgi:hypothetical protein
MRLYLASPILSYANVPRLAHRSRLRSRSLRVQPDQISCEFGGGFELLSYAQCFVDVLHDSTWWIRVWTYQEFLASKRQLFFTDHGLYLQTGPGDGHNITTEGAAFSQNGSVATSSGTFICWSNSRAAH